MRRADLRVSQGVPIRKPVEAAHIQNTPFILPRTGAQRHRIDPVRHHRNAGRWRNRGQPVTVRCGYHNIHSHARGPTGLGLLHQLSLSAHIPAQSTAASQQGATSQQL